MNSSLRRVRIWSASLLKTAGKLQQGHELRERRANAPGKRVIRKKTIKKYVGECYHHYDFVIINHRGGDDAFRVCLYCRWGAGRRGMEPAVHAIRLKRRFGQSSYKTVNAAFWTIGEQRFWWRKYVSIEEYHRGTNYLAVDGLKSAKQRALTVREKIVRTGQTAIWEGISNLPEALTPIKKEGRWFEKFIRTICAFAAGSENTSES